MTDNRTKADWIALDWGTTHLRGWAMSRDGTVLEAAASNAGMGTLSRDGFEPALIELAGHWIDGPVTVVACGMVGSRQGWVEAPYATVPCPPLGGGTVLAPSVSPDLTVRVIPGLRQDSPADVMRGEETQIAGFLSQNPGWDGVLCLPGSHTKWVHISAGEIVSFQTFMTGELFAAVTDHTVLRHSVGGKGWDDSAFDAALAEGMSRPERCAARLFSLRAEHLLHGLDPAAVRSRLSGILIGAELAGARPYWLGQQVGVIGAGSLADIYIRALTAQGVPCTKADDTAVTLAGLAAVYLQLKETA